jgi:hypothetical protein
MLSRAMFGSKGLLYCSMLLAASVTEPPKAQEIATFPQAIEQNGVNNEQVKGHIKQIEQENLLTTIENWLSSHFDLPTIDRHPRIELASGSTIASLGYKKLLSDWSIIAGSATDSQLRTISLYDDLTQTIYVPNGWTGSTDIEVSILVHEMVHHFQNLLGLKYACAQEREQLAYLAQDGWLSQSGRSLASDFDLDPFSLLVATTCKY